MIPMFRAWLPDTDVEKMLRVKTLVFENGRTRCMCGYAYDFYLEDEDAIIMQSTGLFDKNGQEIFEGDIISDGHTSRDIRHHQTLGFYTIDGNGVEGFFGDTASLEDFEEVSKYMSENIEIIGNIYENKDILEVINEKRK
nr:MAG TPA: YopX protein [Caudoviricetes sp.]